MGKGMREQQLQESLKTEGQESAQDGGFHAEAAYQLRNDLVAKAVRPQTIDALCVRHPLLTAIGSPSYGDWNIRLCCRQCAQDFFAQRLPVLRQGFRRH